MVLACEDGRLYIYSTRGSFELVATAKKHKHPVRLMLSNKHALHMRCNSHRKKHDHRHDLFEVPYSIDARECGGPPTRMKVTAVDFSIDGDWIRSNCEGGQLYIWDSKKGKHQVGSDARYLLASELPSC